MTCSHNAPTSCGAGRKDLGNQSFGGAVAIVIDSQRLVVVDPRVCLVSGQKKCKCSRKFGSLQSNAEYLEIMTEPLESSASSVMPRATEDFSSKSSLVLANIQNSYNQKIVYVTLIVLLSSRLCFQLYAAPLPDETYYWLWGIHLSLSYFDHPPLHAWLQGFDARVFGWSVMSLRLLTWPTTVGIVAILFYWSRRFAIRDWRAYFLATSAICFASPLIFVFTTMAYIDHLLILLSYVSVSFFVMFFTVFVARGQQSLLHLYLGAVILGLAGLTKYNAVFVELGLVGTVIALPSLHPLLRSPHIYVAAALTGLLQLPALYWNAANDFWSFRYNLWDRLDFESFSTGLSTLMAVFITSIVVLSPFLIIPMLYFLKSRPKAGPVVIWQSLGFWTFSSSTSAFFFLCFFAYVHFYWNIEAYLMLLPVALYYFPSIRLVRAHLVYGATFSMLFTFNYTVLPLAAIAGQEDFESARVFGWTEIGNRTAAAKLRYDAKFIAASDWQTASQLGFALRDPAVECFQYDRSQFTFWLNNELRNGQDAIILVDEPQLENLDMVIRPKFRGLELVDTIQVIRFGKLLTTYRIFRGISYIMKGA